MLRHVYGRIDLDPLSPIRFPSTIQTETTTFRVALLPLISHSEVFREAFFEANRYHPNGMIEGLDLTIAVRPDILQHFLNYANTGQYPLFYKEHEGFDYGLYEDLYSFAKTYKVPDLARFIEEHSYLQVVTIRYWSPYNEGAPVHGEFPSDVDVTVDCTKNGMQALYKQTIINREVLEAFEPGGATV